MDEEVQNFEQQEAYMVIPQNAEDINIYNKKIKENIHYVLEADPNEVEKMRKSRQN